MFLDILYLVQNLCVFYPASGIFLALLFFRFFVSVYLDTI